MNVESSNDYSFNNDVNLIDLRLLEDNPRYIDKEYDLNKIGKANYDYNETKIMQTLISFEEDLNDLKSLIVSLSLGFRPFEDPIFVKRGIDGKFYVIEGNRRVMSLKLLTIYKTEFERSISENILFKDLLINNKENKAYLDDEIRDNLESSVENNYSVISNIIKNYKNDYIENFSYVFIGDNVKNEDIWILINGRQSAEKTGKRIFKRLHQFYLFLNKFNIFMEELGWNEKNVSITLEKMSKHFGRTINRSTINSAVWCKSLVEIYNHNYPDKKISKLMFAPSAIELARTMISFKNEENEIKSITKNIKLKYKLIEVDDLEKLDYSISKEKFEKVALWLVEKFISGKLSTRGLENDYDSEELRNLIIFDNNTVKSLRQQIEDIKEKKNKKQIITPLEKQLEEYDFTGTEIIKKATENIKNNSNLSFKNKITKTLNYIWTFDIPSHFQKDLYRQNSLPFVSLSASIRSTYDLLIFLSLDVSDELLNILKNFYSAVEFNSFNSKLIYRGNNEKLFNRKKTSLLNCFSRDEINRLINNYDTTPANALRFALKDENNFVSEDIINAILNCDVAVKWIKDNKIKYDILNNLDLIFSFWRTSKNINGEMADRDVLNKIIHVPYIINDSNLQIKIFNSLNKQYKFLFQLLTNLKII